MLSKGCRRLQSLAGREGSKGRATEAKEAEDAKKGSDCPCCVDGSDGEVRGSRTLAFD
jgi:hypothetical protein